MANEDLGACRFWRRSAALEDGVIGIYPAWNAVVGLNPAAAAIWDALVDAQDREIVATTYASQVPERADNAAADVAACLEIWGQQGLLRLPVPKPDRRGTLPGASGHEQFSFHRSLQIGGSAVAVEIEDSSLGAAIRDLVQDFPESPSDPEIRLQALGPEAGWRICLDGYFHRPASDMVEARGIVVGEIISLMAGAKPWKAVLHASVLTDGRQTVLLTGQSGAGKSTLSAELVARGWRLVAEDCAAFDGQMRVAPMPFAFSIKAGSWDALSSRYADLSTAPTHRIGKREMRYPRMPDGARATRPSRPDVIFDIRFRPDLPADSHRVRALGQLETLQLFFNEESYVDFEADPDDQFLSFATETPACSLQYGSSNAAVAALIGRLRQGTPR